MTVKGTVSGGVYFLRKWPIVPRRLKVYVTWFSFCFSRYFRKQNPFTINAFS